MALRLVRTAVALGVSAFSVLAVASCDSSVSTADCDYVVRRCRTVCDYWCDSWGCYPSCWDQCWYDCYVDPTPPPAPAPSPSGDASTPAPPPPATDAGTGGGPGVLCSPCASNDDCKAGALCIQHGGGDAGAASAFCGHPCQTSAECPAEFSCSQIGTSKQCLPVSGVCQ